MCGVDNACGLQLSLYYDAETVKTAFTIPQRFAGYGGMAHGGVVAAVLDEVMAWAANCAARGGTATGEMTLRYRKPVPVETPIAAEGRVVSQRGRIYETEAELTGGGAVLASAKAVFIRPLKDMLDGDAVDFVYKEGDLRLFEDL